MNDAPQPMVIHLFSFGYKHSGPPQDPSGHGGGFVFDCRALPNPFWEESLRPHSGQEAPIAEYFAQRPEVGDFTRHAAALVRYTAGMYREMGRERLMVSFGCTGGRHRSVYQAETLARQLQAEGFEVRLNHLDINKDGRHGLPAS